MELDSYEAGGKPFPGKYKMVGESNVMLELFRLTKKFSGLDETVLLSGESGTGKELVARAIHKESPRSDRPFKVINCSGIPEGLMESQFFGHKKGAFTSAIKDRKGVLREANEGTVFLDEIGDMLWSLQTKLYRVMDGQSFNPVGGSDEFEVDVRYIAATSKSIDELKDDPNFRDPLFYRLNDLSILVPPLRERLDDIPLLTNYFIGRYNDKYQGNKYIDPEALDLLMKYKWPGNVRELMNFVKRLALTGEDDRISFGDVERAQQTEKGKRDYSHYILYSLETLFSAVKELSENYRGAKLAINLIGDAVKGERYTIEQLKKMMDAFGYKDIGYLLNEAKRLKDSFVAGMEGFGDRISGLEGRFGGFEGSLEEVKNRGLYIEGGLKALGDSMRNLEEVKDVVPAAEEVPKGKGMRHIFRDGGDGREYTIKELVGATGIPRDIFYKASRRIEKDNPTIDDMLEYLKESKYGDTFSQWMEELRREP